MERCRGGGTLWGRRTWMGACSGRRISGDHWSLDRKGYTGRRRDEFCCRVGWTGQRGRLPEAVEIGMMLLISVEAPIRHTAGHALPPTYLSQAQSHSSTQARPPPHSAHICETRPTLHPTIFSQSQSRRNVLESTGIRPGPTATQQHPRQQSTSRLLQRRYLFN